MNRKRLFRYAFGKSIPVMMGYLFLGVAFGILLTKEAGLDWYWATVMSLTIYAGSLQFVLTPLIAAHTPLGTVALMSLLVNSRHLFYGLSFIDTYGEMGARRPYMIFSLTDETYSVLCSCKNDEEYRASDHEACFYLSALDHFYWVLGSTVGALLGEPLTLDTTGIDFSMTALFVVILTDQLRFGDRDARVCGALGLAVALVLLFALGADRFLVPALSGAVAALVAYDLLLRRRGAASNG